MLNIGIVGTFDVENYGDLLFPLLAEHELRARLGDVTLHRFSYHAKSAPVWPYDVLSLVDFPDAVMQLDALLLGGGYIIRFDKDVAPGYAPPAPHIHHPTGYWLTPALIAQAHGVPVIWNAPGMHLNDIPDWAEPLLALTLARTPYISVRDRPSKASLQRYVDEDRIEVVPDTGFGIARLLDAQVAAGRPYIVVQPARWMEAFPSFVRAHADRFAAYDILALPIGPVLGDDAELIADLPIVRRAAWPRPLDIAAIVSGASGVVGHSYHLAITALTAGVPVFTSADLDTGKFTALRDFETVHRLVDLRESDPDWFFGHLGKRSPSASLHARLTGVAWHWDRVAAVIGATRAAVPATTT